MPVLGGDDRSTRRASAENAVLDATRTLLDEGRPFAELTVQEIAGRAGLSRPAFYSRFDDKRQLLLRLADDLFAAVQERADETLGGFTSGRGRVPSALRGVLNIVESQRAVYLAVVEAAGYDTDIAAAYDEFAASVRDAVRRRIARQQEMGEARGGDPRLLAYALVGVAFELIRQHLRGSVDLDRDALLEALTMVWTRSVYG